MRYTLFWWGAIGWVSGSVLFAADFTDKLRKVELIDGKSYTVEYRLKADKTLDVEVTHLWTTQGWVRLNDFKAPPSPPSYAGQKGRVVRVGDELFSVQLASEGAAAIGRAYSRREGDQWVSLLDSVPPVVKAPKPATHGSAVGAEIRVYDPLVRELSLTTRITKPFVEDGNRVTPNIHVVTHPEIHDSAHTLSLGVNVDVKGGATSSGGRRVLGRHTSATVTSQMQGQFTRQVDVSPTGLVTGPLKGNVDTSYGVATRTEMRLFRRGAHRQAASKAHASARRKIPVKEQELRSQVDKATRSAVADADRALRGQLAEIEGMGTESHDAFGVTFSSSRSKDSKPSFVSARLSVPSEWVDSSDPKPELKQSKNTAATLYIHEAALTQAVAPLLAKQSISLGQALEIICGVALAKKFDLCREKLNPKVADLAVYFDEADPFQIKFQNDKVLLQLNVSHSQGQSGLRRNPFRVEVQYNVSTQGLERDWVRVTPQKKAELATGEGTPPKTQHDPLAGFINRTVRAIADPAEQRMLEQVYGSAFRQAVPFVPVEVPVSASATDPEQGQAPTPKVTRRVRLGAQDVVAQNGWFGFSSAVNP